MTDRMELEQRQVIVLVAATLVVVGALAPWTTVEMGAEMGEVVASERGTEGWGLATLALGILAAAAVVAVRDPRIASYVAAGALGVAALVALLEVLGTEEASVSFGGFSAGQRLAWGVWVTLAAGLVGAVGALALRQGEEADAGEARG